MSRQVRARALARALGIVVSFALPAVAAGQAWQFTATGSMTKTRTSHTATALADGRVLVVGKYAWDQTAEVYDPVTGTFTATGPLTVAGGSGHTATRLANGKVLVAGGTGGSFTYAGFTRGAELFDPATGTFTATGDMSTPRLYASATLLANGKVLVAGGSLTTWQGWFGTLASAEIYDPATGTFSPTATPMLEARDSHTAVLLGDGKVLLAGGRHRLGSTMFDGHAARASAELFDPSTNAFAATGSMTAVRTGAPGVRLADGRVLIPGGNQVDNTNGPATERVDLYDPATGTFTATGALAAPRWLHAAVLLPDGKVLVAAGKLPPSGYATAHLTATSELYDPATGLFTPGPNLVTARSGATATALWTGRVLFAGGNVGPDQGTASAELFGLNACY